MTVTTYDPEAVYVTMGQSILTGWNSISIARDTVPILTVKGIKGKHTRTLNYDTSATVRLAIPAGSEWNTTFSSLLSLDSYEGTARLELKIKDTGGTSLFHSLEAFVVNYADVTFDASLAERVWVIQCLTTKEYDVGNTTTPAGSLLDAVSSGISSLF